MAEGHDHENEKKHGLLFDSEVQKTQNCTDSGLIEGNGLCDCPETATRLT